MGGAGPTHLGYGGEPEELARKVQQLAGQVQYLTSLLEEFYAAIGIEEGDVGVVFNQEFHMIEQTDWHRHIVLFIEWVLGRMRFPEQVIPEQVAGEQRANVWEAYTGS